MSAPSAAAYLGPYGRVAYGFVNEKAHYTLDQRGAWLTAWCMAGLRPLRDGTVKMRALRGVIGEELLDFLIEEGDLRPTESPELLKFHNFEWANEPMEKNRRNVAAYRDRQRGQVVDNVQSDDSKVTSDVVSSSPSYSSNEEKTLPSASDPTGDFDALDRFYELTGSRPWGRKSGHWITELQAAHGAVNVIAALEVETHDKPAEGSTLISRVAARLERQADRVATAKAREPRRPTGLQAEIAASIASNYGTSFEDGDVLRSGSNGSDPAESLASRPDPALTVGEGSGSRADGGDVLPGVESGERAPSPPETGAAVVHPPNRARSEPGRSTEAPTDGAAAKETA